jgi:NAD(P)-dependent dehydrogenase (short-subunit alcohol dehydrogenase family)
MAPPPFFAIISGVGSGTGASLARRFAKNYAVVLLSRRAASYESIVDDINKSGGTAIGITADATDLAATEAAFAQIAKELPGSKLAAAVYNGGGGILRKPFLEIPVENLETNLNGAA